MKTQHWVLRQRPSGNIGAGDLERVERSAPDLRAGEVLVRNIYLSLDPTNRIWMSDRDQYLPPVAVGETMRGVTLGVVEQTRSERFKAGDLVIPADGGWETHTLADDTRLMHVRRQADVALTAHMSVLGATGATAYFGVTDICAPKPDEIFVVSAAAGAVGSIAGQLAKIAGARTIGIAGGPDKAALISQLYGFDAAIDYRGENVGVALDRLAPDGVDIDFENVGGAIMAAVYARMRNFGRMALCGLIADYNRDGPIAFPGDLSRILMHRLSVRGFIVLDHMKRMGEARKALAGGIAEGKIKWRDHVVDGIENAPEALGMLFTGANDGKLLIRISEEP